MLWLWLWLWLWYPSNIYMTMDVVYLPHSTYSLSLSLWSTLSHSFPLISIQGSDVCRFEVDSHKKKEKPFGSTSSEDQGRERWTEREEKKRKRGKHYLRFFYLLSTGPPSLTLSLSLTHTHTHKDTQSRSLAQSVHAPTPIAPSATLSFAPIHWLTDGLTDWLTDRSEEKEKEKEKTKPSHEGCSDFQFLLVKKKKEKIYFAFVRSSFSVVHSVVQLGVSNFLEGGREFLRSW